MKVAYIRVSTVEQNEARQLEAMKSKGIEKYFTLTYQPEFFKALGFTVINKEELPHKVWKECIDCPKFPNCDEIAMVKV